jgi:hypothetical protein
MKDDNPSGYINTDLAALPALLKLSKNAYSESL